MNPIRRQGEWCGPCSVCGAVAWERWPHPEGEPCPRKVAIDDAYIAMLDAQRMSFLRSGVAVEEMGGSFKRLLGDDG